MSTLTVETIRGLVRPCIALMFCGGAVVGAFTGHIDPMVVGAAAASIAGFYFGERSALKKPGQTDDETNKEG